MKLHVTVSADATYDTGDTEWLTHRIAETVLHNTHRSKVYVIGTRRWPHPDTATGPVDILVEVVAAQQARVLADDVRTMLALVELGVGTALKPDEAAAIERLRAACTRSQQEGNT